MSMDPRRIAHKRCPLDHGENRGEEFDRWMLIRCRNDQMGGGDETTVLHPKTHGQAAISDSSNLACFKASEINVFD